MSREHAPASAARGQVIFSTRTVPFVTYLNLVTFARHFWTERHLIAQFTRREITGRYRSSLLGLAWSFITPLVLLLVYTFVFGVIFKQRWPGMAADSLAEFGLVLFAGLIAFGLFSESITRAPALIVNAPNYVTRVIFPLECLPISVVGSAIFHAVVSLTVLLTVRLATGGSAHLTWLLIPVTLLPIAMLSLAFAWVLSSLGVFLRDLHQAIALMVQVLFFVTPIFYPLDALPRSLQPYVRLNPLTGTIDNLRAVIFVGAAPPWSSLLLPTVIAGVAMLAAYAWFMRTRRAFGDVM